MPIVNIRATREAERGRDDKPPGIAIDGAPARDCPGKDGVMLSGSERPLSLSEVRSIGRPAIFLDWGEALLFRNGVLFDVQGTADGRALSYPPEELPAQVLETGVGIDYGWRHLAGCDCTLCCESAGERVYEAGCRS